MTTVTSNRMPVYKNIKAELLRRIGRTWQPGDRLPSIRELSNELGCGYVNTHRAVKELTQDGFLSARDRVGVFVPTDLDVRKPDQARAELDTRKTPAHVARPLAGLRVATIAVDFEPDLFIRRMIESFEHNMRQHGCILERMCFDKQKVFATHNIQAEAIAVIHPGGPVHFSDKQIGVVASTDLAERFGIYPPRRNDFVTVAHHHGGILAGQYMREAGIEDVCYIGRRSRRSNTDCWDPISSIRLAGFEQGFGKVIPEDRGLAVPWYGPSEGARVVKKFLEMQPRPQGVFTTTDDLALGFIHGAQAHGLEPGRDYQIIGFDGQQAGRELRDGPLTTIDIPSAEMGRVAAEMLTDRMLNPDQPVRILQIGGELYEGRTVRPQSHTREER